MELEKYLPRPALVTKTTQVLQPRFPVIDCHNHLSDIFGGDSIDWVKRPLPELLELMDRCGLRGFVDLDGMWGEAIFHSHVKAFKEPDPERFRVFCGVDWKAWPEHGDRFGEWAAQELRKHAREGADGLKVWKDLGLQVVDHKGQRVAVDDPRLEPLWAAAGELGLPVTLHLADPVAFFDPLDEHNERWEELQAYPDWQFPSPPFPPFLSIMAGMAAVVSRHPQTTFIGAHAGCYAENLGWVGGLMERCPNFYIDISARIAELGRQPYTARRFFIQHADRILFGLDNPLNPRLYQLHYRFLESDDEYFPYGLKERPGQGRWAIYGLYLPEDVLEQVYAENARRLFHFA
jgi:predicted TIM-barrel fold metal-dependent hydrolase